MPQGSKKKHKPNNLYDFDPKFFHKHKSKPVIFEVEVNDKDLHHLKHDDIDEMSRLEVTYKILKQQLRDHQKLIISKKEEEKEKAIKAKEEAMKG